MRFIAASDQISLLSISTQASRLDPMRSKRRCTFISHFSTQRIFPMTSSTHEPSEALRVGAALYTQPGFVRFAWYNSGEIAIEILEEDGAPQCVATVALTPYGAPHPGEYGVWLKGWHENEGLPQALVEAGIVSLTGETHPTGHCEAQRAELMPAARAVYDRVLLDEQNRERVHQEIDELVKVGVFTAKRAGALKERLTGPVMTGYIGDGMNAAEIIDLHNDLLG
jgi:hypothetical protein